MEVRQLFVPFPSDGATVPTLTGPAPECSTALLPANGILSMGHGEPPITLTHAAIYRSNCPTPAPEADGVTPVIIANAGGIGADEGDSGMEFSDFREPFYASTFPVCYALAATTVTAYMLVIMLFITPRSFLDGGVVYLGRRGGFTSGSSGGVTIGGRPWLQKVAALTVAISLTVATGQTFNVAEQQYSWGIQNAKRLQLQVMDATELKIIRLISDTFLWLAQAQTLIRLFPRQREKVIIKWTAFALISLDVVFSALNSFQYAANGGDGNARPRSFMDAIPALSYLFQLSLGLLYAAWVIYYSLMKKRYAFYHPFMKNMVLVSIISLISILVPVVFFILDISKPDFTGWGDYVRWVGAAAASVVVWEWVERIEALEREEKKDGILGREVFDGDEMIEISASEFPWLRGKARRGGGRPDSGGSAGGMWSTGRANIRTGLSSLTSRYHRQVDEKVVETANQPTQRTIGDRLRPPLWPSRPAPAVTPVSRSDTPSAASTVYAVRYQQPSDATGHSPAPPPQQGLVAFSHSDSSERSHHGDNDDAVPTVSQTTPPAGPEAGEAGSRSQNRWRSLAQAANPLFRRAPREPPAEVRPHAAAHRETARAPREDLGRRDFRSRMEDFAVTQAEKFRTKMRPAPETDSLPVTVIPAPPRRGAAIAQMLEEERASGGGTGSPQGGNSAGSGEALRQDEPGPLERNDSHLSGQTHQSQDANFVAPPMWPGVYQRYDDSRSSAGSSFDMTRPAGRGGGPAQPP